MDKEIIDRNFSYHKPTEEKAVLYTSLRKEAKWLAHEINKCCPDSREKDQALLKLEEVVMWANASIARN